MGRPAVAVVGKGKRVKERLTINEPTGRHCSVSHAEGRLARSAVRAVQGR